MTNKRAVVSVALVAVAIGYVLGMGRSTPPRGEAAAAGFLDASAGNLITHREDGDTVTVWKMKDGLPIAARTYLLEVHQYDHSGPMTNRLVFIDYTGPAVERGK